MVLFGDHRSLTVAALIGARIFNGAAYFLTGLALG